MISHPLHCIFLYFELKKNSEKKKRTEEEVGRQHQGIDRPGVWQDPEGSGEQGKMEKKKSFSVKEKCVQAKMGLHSIVKRDANCSSMDMSPADQVWPKPSCRA